VPLSRRLDRWIGFRFGKSLLAVWRQADARADEATPNDERVDDGCAGWRTRRAGRHI